MPKGTAQPEGVTNRLAEFREAKGWNQLTLAFHAGVSVRTISQIENGHRPRTNTPTKRAIANALTVPVTELFPEQPEQVSA